MDTIDHIKALVRVWKGRAKDLEEQAELCTDFLKKAEMLTTAEICRKHVSEIKNVLKRK